MCSGRSRNQIGALPDPAIPIALVAAVVVGALAVANLAALLPAAAPASSPPPSSSTTSNTPNKVSKRVSRTLNLRNVWRAGRGSEGLVSWRHQNLETSGGGREVSLGPKQSLETCLQDNQPSKRLTPRRGFETLVSWRHQNFETSGVSRRSRRARIGGRRLRRWQSLGRRSWSRSIRRRLA